MSRLLVEELLADSTEPKLLIIQPSPFCNINCSYCYLKDRANHSLMSVHTLQAIANNIIAKLQPSTASLVNWHAGEPTAVPLQWYRTATELLASAKRGAPLHFSMQTNGVSLDKEWAKFLSETSTDVGISIDGPEDLHDRHRQTKSGKGTWRLAMSALDRLRAQGIEPSVITVITAETLDRADDLLDFYAEHNLSRVSLNFEELEGANTTSSLSSAEAPARAERFLVSFLRKSIDRKLQLHVREAERILSVLLADGSYVAYNDQVVPLAILTISYQGGLYTFSPEFTEYASDPWQHLQLGNVHFDSLIDIAGGSALRRLTAEVAQGLAACKATCSMWRVCGGGAPVNRLSETGSLSVAETQFCRLNVQAMVRALKEVLSSSFSNPNKSYTSC